MLPFFFRKMYSSPPGRRVGHPPPPRARARPPLLLPLLHHDGQPIVRKRTQDVRKNTARDRRPTEPFFRKAPPNAGVELCWAAKRGEALRPRLLQVGRPCAHSSFVAPGTWTWAPKVLAKPGPFQPFLAAVPSVRSRLVSPSRSFHPPVLV